MLLPGTLRAWLRQILPAAGPCAQEAAHGLLRALLCTFTTNLCQLARQLPRAAAAKEARQYLARWLDHAHWEPAVVYADLNRQVRRLLGHRGSVPLLVDFTHLEKQWTVLQVSLPWQGRALPLYRLVFAYTDPEVGQKEQVRTTTAFLRARLPGPQQRYVLVMDRGFPSHLLIRELQAGGWRFVLRISGEWKLTHPDYTGQLKEAAARPELVGPRARTFQEGLLGQRGKGRAAWSRTHVVSFHGLGHQEPWFLATSAGRARWAVAVYRQRMRIEAEFRDLKGPLGLDGLAAWEDQDRVARFLAWVAVYEWWLAHLWLKYRLHEWAPCVTVAGKLSWIRVTREWLLRQFLSATNLALDFL
jgi:hypothetical protein